MTKLARSLACLLALTSAPAARASIITLHLGPPAIGSGGPNPISVPPTNPLEYEAEYITDSNYEFSLGVTPGILAGLRTLLGSSKAVYVGVGGGLVIDSNGTGPGGYFAVGVNYGGSFMFNAEIKQAIGYDFSANQLINPYAIRLGISYAL